MAEAKASDLKEILNQKNYEITTLSANNSALQTEVELLKAELANVRAELNTAASASEVSSTLQGDYDHLLSLKSNLELDLENYKSSAQELNSQVSELNTTISKYETEISDLKSSTKAAEQDAFIDRLFKQLDLLTDERLSLLNEKEEMSNQLLKMNETVASISQHVDSHSIDTSELDSHRKNVILAGGSSNNSSDKTIMKKQINELVREIDKCIALLSA